MTEVAIWVQLTSDSSSVQIRYWPKGNRSLAKLSDRLTSTTANDHITTFVIPGLDFGTAYEYEVMIDATAHKRGYPTEFKTQPHFRFRTEPPEFTIALGSCSYINDAPFDRPGNPYGGDYEIFTAIDKQNPDMMLWLGDNDYYREPDWLTESAMRNRWRTGRKLPEMQPLLGRTANYAIWDDHDYGPNDSDRSFRLRDVSLGVFQDYWPSVVRGTNETKGCFFRFEFGDCEFFMLDDRYHRSPNNAPDNLEKVMFGKAQSQWLKDSLLNSKAPFKFICNGNQMVQPLVLYEGFKQFPFEQTELFDFIAANKIDGVVFLSGDRHITELLKVQWPNVGYPWYEYTSSPLNSGAGKDDREAKNEARVPGTWVTQKRNFGLIKVTGKRGERKLIMTAHDKTGVELWRHEIAEKELKVPK